MQKVRFKKNILTLNTRKLKMDWNFVQQLVLCVYGFIIIGNALNDENAQKTKTYDEKTSLLRECSVQRSLEKVSADFTF